MTPRQKLMVQATFEKALLHGDLVGELFYRRLFELDPGLKQLFAVNMDAQSGHLMRMIALIVKGLDHPDETAAVIHDLGARHSGYGIDGDHFEVVGRALLWALEAGIGGQFTPEVREAWVAFYRMVAETMRGAEGTGRPVIAVRH